MSVVITRKLGYPFNPEAAFGAVAEDGSLYISEMAGQTLTSEEMNEVLKDQQQEIQRRIQKLRSGHPLPDIKGRTVILADDGIATGATLFASIELCKKQKAGKIVVAAPISGERMDTLLRSKVDDVIILEKPSFYSAVSQGYEDFSNLTDEEALAFLDQWEKEYHPTSCLEEITRRRAVCIISFGNFLRLIVRILLESLALIPPPPGFLPH